MVRRVVLGFLAVVVILAAGVLGAAGAWAYSTFRDGGAITFDLGVITPEANASSIVMDLDRFSATVPYVGGLGRSELTARSVETGDPTGTLFLGAGPTSDVDAFIQGTPYAVAINDGSAWEVRPVPGRVAPASPAEQDFWLASSVGRPADIVVPAARPLTLLVMHPAGVPTGPVQLTVDFRIPTAMSWALGLTVAAALLLVLGIVLLVLALRRGGGPGRHAKGTIAEEPTTEERAAEEPAADEPATEEAAAEGGAPDDDSTR